MSRLIRHINGFKTLVYHRRQNTRTQTLRTPMSFLECTSQSTSHISQHTPRTQKTVVISQQSQLKIIYDLMIRRLRTDSYNY